LTDRGHIGYNRVVDNWHIIDGGTKMRDKVIEMVQLDKCEVKETRPSALGLSEPVVEIVGLLCPRCGTKRRYLKNGKSGQCANCGLHFRVYGNALFCSDAKMSQSDILKFAD